MDTRVVGRIVALAALAASIQVGAAASARAQGAVPGPGATVKCQSQAGQRQVCPADTSAGVTLAKETGAISCVLGQTWSYDATSVWVQDGCAGEFELGAREKPFLGNLTTDGQLMAHGAFYNDEVELQNSLSFLGLGFSAGDKIKIFARWEWGVNFIRGGAQFNAGSTTTGGFLTLDQVDTPLFGNRLGYVGVDFGSAGRLTVGKQNAVHYDIAGYTTDRWNVFGGQGSIAYPAGTDGGTLGVGRVDQAVGYRLTALEILELGGQLQFRNANNDEPLDGYGVSAQVTVLPGLKVGGAYTETYFSQDVKDAVPGLQGSAQYGILGARYSNDLLELGAVWATQRNGDAVRLPMTDVAGAPGDRAGRVRRRRPGALRQGQPRSLLGPRGLRRLRARPQRQPDRPERARPLLHPGRRGRAQEERLRLRGVADRRQHRCARQRGLQRLHGRPALRVRRQGAARTVLRSNMSHRRWLTTLGIALAIGGFAGGCKQDRGQGALHAQLTAREREADGLRASLARAERGEPILPEDAVVVSVSESVIKEFLDAQLPFEVEAGSFKVTLAQAAAVFKGSPAVNLTGAIAPTGHPDLVGEVRAQGALEDIKVDPESGTLRATVAIDHVDLVKMAGLEKFIGKGSLDELARTVRKQLEGHVPEVQIPVKIEQGIELPSITDGPVLIQGARMPLEVAVADVFAGGGLLWVAVKVVPGELVKTAACRPTAAGPTKGGAQ